MTNEIYFVFAGYQETYILFCSGKTSTPSEVPIDKHHSGNVNRIVSGEILEIIILNTPYLINIKLNHTHSLNHMSANTLTVIK